MRCDVVAVRVRYEREGFRVPRVEPQILPRQIHAALVSNIDHTKIYPWTGAIQVFPRCSHAAVPRLAYSREGRVYTLRSCVLTDVGDVGLINER